MSERKSLRLKYPAHPGRFVRSVIIEALELSIAEAAKMLGIMRVALSHFLKERTALSPGMAIRFNKATSILNGLPGRPNSDRDNKLQSIIT